MLTKLFNDQNWNSLLKANPNHEMFKMAVEKFLKPDIIDTHKFYNNLKVVQSTWEQQLLSGDSYNQIKTTPSLVHFKDPLKRPIGYPTWFMAGYPDVANWISNNVEAVHDKPPFIGLFESDENYVDIEKGYVKPEVIRLIIDYYKKNISSKLECQA